MRNDRRGACTAKWCERNVRKEAGVRNVVGGWGKGFGFLVRENNCACNQRHSNACPNAPTFTLAGFVGLIVFAAKDTNSGIFLTLAGLASGWTWWCKNSARICFSGKIARGVATGSTRSRTHPRTVRSVHGSYCSMHCWPETRAYVITMKLTHEHVNRKWIL
jgi:hypothetical protein